MRLGDAAGAVGSVSPNTPISQRGCPLPGEDRWGWAGARLRLRGTPQSQPRETPRERIRSPLPLSSHGVASPGSTQGF